MSALSPCPFCGGEAWLKEYKPTVSGVAICTECGARSPICRGDHTGGWKAHAIEAWNRRAERTCYVESSRIELEIGDYSYLEVELSCGHAFTWDDGTPPDYCPHCGARIEVDE